MIIGYMPNFEIMKFIILQFLYFLNVSFNKRKTIYIKKKFAKA